MPGARPSTWVRTLTRQVLRTRQRSPATGTYSFSAAHDRAGAAATISGSRAANIRMTTSGWEPAVNLGCIINTPYDEDGPTYFQDNETGVVTLYFTSLNRPGNIGDFDIYASTLQAEGPLALDNSYPSSAARAAIHAPASAATGWRFTSRRTGPKDWVVLTYG